MKTSFTIALLAVAVCTTGCSEQTTNEMGETVDSATNAVSDAAHDAGQATADAMDNMGQAASEATAGAANSLKDAGNQTVTAAKIAVDDASAVAGDAKDKLTAGMAALVDQARSKLAEVEGGPAMLSSVTQYFAQAKEALSGITDKESAQAAVAKLKELSGSLEGVSEKMGALPEQAKAALASVIEKGRETLKTLVEKYKDNPTVKDVIQPRIDEMMDKLSALTGSNK